MMVMTVVDGMIVATPVLMLPPVAEMDRVNVSSGSVPGLLKMVMGTATSWSPAGKMIEVVSIT